MSTDIYEPKVVADVLYVFHTNGSRYAGRLPGSNVTEWLALAEHDWDEIDRFYIDHETIGA